MKHCRYDCWVPGWDINLIFFLYKSDNPGGKKGSEFFACKKKKKRKKKEKKKKKKKKEKKKKEPRKLQGLSSGQGTGHPSSL